MRWNESFPSAWKCCKGRYSYSSESGGSPENISEFHPDLIILACGSSPSVPQIPGLCLPDGQPKRTFILRTVSSGPRRSGVKLQTDGLPVAVLGGGLIGTEAAETLSLLGLPCHRFELWL